MRSPVPALRHVGEHNLASLFEQVGGEGALVDEFSDDHDDVRMIPDAEAGLRLGMQVRHAKFGVGAVRRIEGEGIIRK